MFSLSIALVGSEKKLFVGSASTLFALAWAGVSDSAFLGRPAAVYEQVRYLRLSSIPVSVPQVPNLLPWLGVVGKFTSIPGGWLAASASWCQTLLSWAMPGGKRIALLFGKRGSGQRGRAVVETVCWRLWHAA